MSDRIHPLGCSCHVLAVTEVAFTSTESRLIIRQNVAKRSVRHVLCEVHQPHRYLPRMVAR